jgi:hypothetical protein
MYHPIEFPDKGTNGTFVFVNVFSRLGPRLVFDDASFSSLDWVVFHQGVGGAHAHARPKKYPSRVDACGADVMTTTVSCVVEGFVRALSVGACPCVDRV